MGKKENSKKQKMPKQSIEIKSKGEENIYY